jgi:S1-C subfamily serine protease
MFSLVITTYMYSLCVYYNHHHHQVVRRRSNHSHQGIRRYRQHHQHLLLLLQLPRHHYYQMFSRESKTLVQITSTRSNPNELIIINGIPATGRSTALGSGFVYDNQGHIITNYHVVDAATKADVTFTDGNTYSAKVIGKDPNSDLAVL